MKGYVIATLALILLLAVPYLMGYLDLPWARTIGVVIALLGVIMAFVLGTVMTSGLENLTSYGLVLIVAGAAVVLLTYSFPVGL